MVDDRGSTAGTPDYTALPPTVPLDATIATVDAGDVPDPEGVRNAEQHRALRDD